MGRRPTLVLLVYGVGCRPSLSGAPESLGSGGGTRSVLAPDTGRSPIAWVGYDAATVTVSGVPVCDRVWDTVGEASDISCTDCALAVSVHATVRTDVGSGEGCPPGAYDNDYAWRPSSTDAALPLGLLAHQPTGWVWIGEAALEGDLFVGSGSFVDGDQVTAFTVVGRVSTP